MRVCVCVGGALLSNACTKTHTNTHLCLDMKTKELNIYFLASANLCQSVLTQFLKPFHNFRRSKNIYLEFISTHNLTQILMGQDGNTATLELNSDVSPIHVLEFKS